MLRMKALQLPSGFHFGQMDVCGHGPGWLSDAEEGFRLAAHVCTCISRHYQNVQIVQACSMAIGYEFAAHAG